MEREGDGFGSQVVVEIEVALIERPALWPQREKRRGRVVLGAEDEGGRVSFRLLGCAGDLRCGKVVEEIDGEGPMDVAQLDRKSVV